MFRKTLFCFVFIAFATGIAMDDSLTLHSARMVDLDTIELVVEGQPVDPSHTEFFISPKVEIRDVDVRDSILVLSVAPLSLDRSYTLTCAGQTIDVRVDGVLDRYVSDKPMGFSRDGKSVWFRLFAPRAVAVDLNLGADPEHMDLKRYRMQRDGDGVWQVQLPDVSDARYYAYRIWKETNTLDDPPPLIADPYSTAVTTRNEFRHPARSILPEPTSFDWEGDRGVGMDWRDLIIYECHVRDLTAHSSSGVQAAIAGSYDGFVSKDIRGGLEHIKSLGVNAVEFLPIHEFGNIEIPFNIPVDGVVNTWNPYARNHWGYMTSFFFAPEAYYASGQTLTPGAWCGRKGDQVREFKSLVKAIHQQGLAVILDVVYNHVAQYDRNSFKTIDREYYFHLDPQGQYMSKSGCGNDFRTDRPMSKRLIVESVRHWMQEYHIDGFRFDLAAMIDWETIDAIRKEAMRINPDVILIAEPWGGGEYEPAAFSRHGWAAWNDHFRNGVKGQNPVDGQSFIFGTWWADNTKESLKRYIRGTLEEEGGLFQTSAHSINYLESHDDHTLGDFIRIGSGQISPESKIVDLDDHVRVSGYTLKANKLAALVLFTSQGGVMIHEGQEYARSKVIAPTAAPDPHVGLVDHNSYNKDNETNWMNFRHADMNRQLVDYYRGLIALRKRHPAFRRSPAEAIDFLHHDAPLALGYLIHKQYSNNSVDLLVLLNADPEQSVTFHLPFGSWNVLVDPDRAGEETMYTVDADTIVCAPTSGMVLSRL